MPYAVSPVKDFPNFLPQMPINKPVWDKKSPAVITHCKSAMASCQEFERGKPKLNSIMSVPNVAIGEA